MQRKACFPAANCSIKMPESISMPVPENMVCEDESEQQQRRQQLISFGHSQWGFNNWSWTVTKQELDFVDFANGKYCAGVVAFVSITVKSLDIHRENIGYATTIANNKGFAIYKSRKCAVTNALRETLLSFGGTVATELMDILDIHKNDVSSMNTGPSSEQLPENNQSLPNKQTEPKNAPVNKNARKDSSDSCGSSVATNMRPPPPAIKNAMVPNPPPVAKAHPMPASMPPAANRPLAANAPRLPAACPPGPPGPPGPAHVRPNPNELLEGMSEEEARAERKRRQKLAQEEFRLKQLTKHKAGHDSKQDLSKSCSFDNLLLGIPTQDIVIEESGVAAKTGKRKSPVSEGNMAKRRLSTINKLDVIQSE